MSEKTISLEKLRLLCESLEDDLSDAILIIDRHADCIEELEAKLAKVTDALSAFKVFENTTFSGPSARDNRMSAFYTVKRKLLAALNMLEVKP